MKINATHYKQLKKYERYLTTAHYANYITGIGTKTANDMKALYEKITGHEFPMNATCGKCRLELCKKLGSLYFTYEEENKKTEKQ